jgi:hypothetical protein
LSLAFGEDPFGFAAAPVDAFGTADEREGASESDSLETPAAGAVESLPGRLSNGGGASRSRVRSSRSTEPGVLIKSRDCEPVFIDPLDAEGFLNGEDAEAGGTVVRPGATFVAARPFTPDPAGAFVRAFDPVAGAGRADPRPGTGAGAAVVPGVRGEFAVPG